MATVQQQVGEVRFVIDEVSWEAYQALCRSWASRSKRMTYDRGRLEFMSPLFVHENAGRVLGRIVFFYAMARGILARTGGSTTLRDEDEGRGLEPDECFWIQNEPRLRNRDYDPEIDPPPDLCIEVDITSSSLPRMSIYATLGVPEVWRYNGTAVTIQRLEESEYQNVEESLALPGMTAEALMRFLVLSGQVNEMELVREVSDWAREAKPSPPAKPRRPRKK